ncbi:hypothetical protein FGG90_10580 [Clavibacter tessellarius]|uniref:Uncharacterized protein n=1 Tax=Clavibacter tessellarius TaxID=31965 RepID=A0A225C7C1_9MICO|nr:hypothetical protein [Clavibacter michiganensis]OQJ62608.1 hypothetical protein B5P24_06135 [Clavibacter michiganensis subsp. tessellarius]UKF34402.1 hypothetical protein FGG90_10580 [Clavibacter michiganensis subsp. tessellarius]
MSTYSAESQRLAHELVARAAENLARSGKSVYYDSEVGRYVVVEPGGAADARWIRVGPSHPPRVSRWGRRRR